MSPRDSLVIRSLLTLFVISGLLVALPAHAQSVAGLTVTPNSVRGGDSALGAVTLSAPAPAGGVAVHLNSTRQDVLVRDPVVVPEGQTSVAFPIRTLPRDGTVDTSVQASLNSSVRTAALTVQSGPASRVRIATFRPDTGEWFLRGDDGRAVTARMGLPGDVPVPGNYYDGSFSGRPDSIAIFHPSTNSTVPTGCDTGTAAWNLRGTVASLGIRGDLPVPANYGMGFGGGLQAAVFRPSTAEWIIRQTPNLFCFISSINGVTTVDNGTRTIRFPTTPVPGDIPVPAPYLSGGSRVQLAVFRPRTAEWFLRGDDGSAMRVQWGTTGDIPVPGDYLGIGRAQIAVFRPSTREWFVRRDDGTTAPIPFGGPEDVPVPGNYLGMNGVQIAVFRPVTAEWFIRPPDGQDAIRVQWGGPSDRPVPAAYGPLTP